MYTFFARLIPFIRTSRPYMVIPLSRIYSNSALPIPFQNRPIVLLGVLVTSPRVTVIRIITQSNYLYNMFSVSHFPIFL